MLQIYAIIGDSNVRKSCVARSLTGAIGKICPNWDVAYHTGTVDTYVSIDSPQESKMLPVAFADAIAKAGVGCAIVTLRYDKMGSRPNAEAYLKEFASRGWRIAEPAILGGRLALPGYPHSILVPNSNSVAGNEIAARLRGHWPIL